MEIKGSTEESSASDDAGIATRWLFFVHLFSMFSETFFPSMKTKRKLISRSYNSNSLYTNSGERCYFSSRMTQGVHQHTQPSHIFFFVVFFRLFRIKKICQPFFWNSQNSSLFTGRCNFTLYHPTIDWYIHQISSKHWENFNKLWRNLLPHQRRKTPTEICLGCSGWNP